MRLTSKVGAALLAASLLSTAGFATQAAATASHVHTGGTLTVAFSQEPDTLNPAQTGLIAVAEIDRNVFDTLTWLNAKGQVTPDLATHWTISNGGKTYTFQLRQGVKFTDGTPFNAQAVVANFNYIMAPATHSISALGALGTFQSAKATGPYTVVVNLKTPFGWFLTNLAEPVLGMQSPTAIKKGGAQYGLQPVGTGPFEVKQFVPNSKVVLVRNPAYKWAPAAEGNHGAAYLNSLVYDIVQSGQSRVDELQSGQAQAVDSTPPLSFKTLKATPGYSSLLVGIPGAGEYAVFNNSKFPTNDPAVRKAILYFLNRQGLINLADQGQYPILWGPLQPGTLGYNAAYNGMYSYNPKKGAQLLTKDGWKKVGGIWTKGGKPLSIIITNPSGVLDLPLLSEAIQGYLQKAGMQVKIEQFADAAWHGANVKGVENIMPLAFSSLTPDLLRIEFTPGQYFNWSKYKNPQVTKLVMAGLAETNATLRMQDYYKAETILMNDAASIPIHALTNLMIFSSKVKGETIYTGGDVNYYSAYMQ